MEEQLVAVTAIVIAIVTTIIIWFNRETTNGNVMVHVERLREKRRILSVAAMKTQELSHRHGSGLTMAEMNIPADAINTKWKME